MSKPTNPTEQFAAETSATIRKVRQETKDRRFDWAVIKVSELDPAPLAGTHADVTRRMQETGQSSVLVTHCSGCGGLLPHEKRPGCVVLEETAEARDTRQAAVARARLKAREDAPVRFGPERDLAAVWMREGEPDSEPDFPIPIKPVEPAWVFVEKHLLDRKMPLGMRANDSDYEKLALDFFGQPSDSTSIPVRVYANQAHVAVWLHEGKLPSEPKWPGKVEVVQPAGAKDTIQDALGISPSPAEQLAKGATGG